MADDTPHPPLPTPPPETPGPSVPPPLLPESDTERQEWADAMIPDAEALEREDPDDVLAAQEESAAGAEAAAIGGPRIVDSDDPSMQPLYEAGQGEEEGWEAAERDLIENATHADGRGDPTRDAFTPEAESDRSGAAYGAADSTPSTEVVHDPDGEPDDPGDGPDVSFDRQG